MFEYQIVPCLSDDNYTVLAVPTRHYEGSKLPPPISLCEIIRSVMVPVSLWGYGTGVEDDIRLTWTDPYCAPCEDRGEVCGFKSDVGLATGCSDLSSSGIGIYNIFVFIRCILLNHIKQFRSDHRFLVESWILSLGLIEME